MGLGFRLRVEGTEFEVGSLELKVESERLGK